MKLRRNLLLIFILIFSLPACGKNTENNQKNISTNKETIQETKEEIYKAKLMFVGDILPHNNFHKYAKKFGNGKYNYDFMFENIKDFTNGSDLFVGNNEFTHNPDKKVSGYPMFNAAEEIYKTIKDAGFDVLTTANNHSLDTGVAGISTTIDAIEKNGMKNSGTQKVGDKNYLIKEVNNIKIGILSYTESLNGLDSWLDTDEKKSQINRLDADKIKEDIENVKAYGAEFIVVCPHWGIEYSSYPEKEHIKLARNMIDWGANIVIGSHPHVVQPREEYTSENGSKGIIYYSLGNFVSNQTLESIGDQRVEHGLLVEMDIEKSNIDNKVKIKKDNYHVTWVQTTHDKNGMKDEVYLVDEYLEGGKKHDNASSFQLKRMKKAKEMTDKTVNTEVK